MHVSKGKSLVSISTNQRGIWNLTVVIPLLSFYCLINFTILTLLKPHYIVCDFVWLATSWWRDTVGSAGSHNPSWLPHLPEAQQAGGTGWITWTTLLFFFCKSNRGGFVCIGIIKAVVSHHCCRAVRRGCLLVFLQQQQWYFFITWLSSAENFKEY